MVFNQFIIIYISLLNNIISLKLNVNKKFVNSHRLLKYVSLINKSSYNNYSERTLINLPIQQSELGLYVVNINIGDPKQDFALILDSGSSIIWVYDDICNSCKSKNKFVSSKSKTIQKLKENINLNYISGNIKGNLCQDYLNFNNVNIPSFYFLLVYESNIEFEIDGILGVSKGSFNKKYSFLNQLKEKKIIKNNILLYDLFNKSFYIGEIPEIYLEQKSISCKNKDYKSNFWKCDINHIKIDNIPIIIESEIIFDSGTNGMIFPIKYKEIFQNIIKNNPIFKKGKCELEYFSKEKFYQIICNNTLEYKNKNNSVNFLEIYLDKGDNNSVRLQLSDLLDEDEKTFYLFFLERKKEILLGSQFFEKYPVLFNLDDNRVVIFGTGNDLYKYRKNFNYKIGTIQIILIVVIFILLLLIFARIQCINRRTSSYNQIELLV